VLARALQDSGCVGQLLRYNCACQTPRLVRCASRTSADTAGVSVGAGAADASIRGDLVGCLLLSCYFHVL
jgi:hypothetical protein